MKGQLRGKVPEKFPWKPPFVDRCRAFLISDKFRTGEANLLSSVYPVVISYSTFSSCSPFCTILSRLRASSINLIHHGPDAPAHVRHCCYAGLQLAVGVFGASVFPLVHSSQISYGKMIFLELLHFPYPCGNILYRQTRQSCTNHLQVPRMRLPQDCLAATLYVVTSLLIAQSDDIGDKFIGAAAVVGPTWAGAVVAGVVVSLLKSWS